MRRLPLAPLLTPLLLLGALLGAAAAQPLALPAEATATPGGFVSLPLRGSGDAALRVDADPPLQLLGTPALQDGRALLNLLLPADTPAGSYRVRVTLAADPATPATAATTVVRVAAVAGVRLRPGAGAEQAGQAERTERTVARGDPARFELLVTNDGNAADVFELAADSGLAARVSPATLELAAGETGVATVVPDTSQAGSRLTRVTATSRRDPAVQAVVVLRTRVLEFRGADGVRGPRLVYDLRLGASYGSGGLDYGVRGGLGGELSDFVTSSVGASLTGGAAAGGPTLAALAPSGVSGELQLAGERWSVRYRGRDASQRLDVQADPFGAYAALLSNGYGAGVSYRAGAFEARLAHVQQGADRQALQLGYELAVAPGVVLAPFVGAQRQGGAEVAYAGLVGLEAELQSAYAVASGALRMSYPFDGAPEASVTLASRSLEPLSVSASAALGPSGASAALTVGEALTDELTLQQQLAYEGELSGRFGAGYAPAALPLALDAFVGGALRAGAVHAHYGAAARVRFEALSLGAYYQRQQATSFGGSVTAALAPLDLAVGYRHRQGDAGGESLLEVRLAADRQAWFAALDYGYDLRAGAHLGALQLGYRFPRGHAVYGSAARAADGGLSWRLGASYLLSGGFATPEPLVRAFGGRAVGTLRGVVFHDADRDGVRDPGEEPVAGATVAGIPRVDTPAPGTPIFGTPAPAAATAGATAGTTADDAGAFELELPPGSATLAVTDVPPTLALRRDLQLELQQGQRVVLDVPLETVANLVGTVVADGDRDGRRDAGEAGLPGVRVELRNAAGERWQALSDRDGDFFVQHLLPGDYTLTVMADSLPRRFEATTPVRELTLPPGTTSGVTLGAAARERRVVTSLSASDLRFALELAPNPAPPGADLQLRVRASGAVDEVTATLGDATVVLEPTPEGDHRAVLTVPAVAAGVASVTVRARRGDETASQQSLLIVTPGPLAALGATPARVDAGATVQLDATLLTRVETAVVVLDGAEWPLRRVDAYRFAGELPTPEEPGVYHLELRGDGVALAGTNVRVDAPMDP